jgi:hypothetical protein
MREEKHGDDPVLACDIKIKADVSNKFLDELSPGLRAAIFTKDGTQEALVDGDDHLTVLNFPQLAPIKFAVGMVGGEITLHGPKKADDLTFECEVKEATLASKEGGTVELTFQAAVLPTPEESGKIAAMLGKDVKVTVKPVEQPSQPPLE